MEYQVSGGILQWVLQVILMFVVAGIIAGFICVNVMFMIWLERKVCARIQNRMGPMWTGPHSLARVTMWLGGLLQSAADALKLLLKEDVIPTKADRWVFITAPVVMFTATIMSYAVIPFTSDLIVLKDFNIGFLYVLAIGSFAVVSLLMAGWSSNNKYSLLGAMRSAAQIISYEVPLVLSLLGVVMLVGSLKMEDIIVYQGTKGWLILFQPLAFIIYVIAAVAETNRPPFDLPEAESELVSGFNIEYSGMRFAMFFLAEFANMFVAAAIASTLFFGGGSGPVLPPLLWFFIKTYAMVFLFMWIRWTFPRLRVDHLMEFGWKVLTPLAFFNILLTGVEIIINKHFLIWILFIVAFIVILPLSIAKGTKEVSLSRQ